MSQQIEELASCLEAVIFIIKLDISRFGVKGPALRIELVSKQKISVFNPRGMHRGPKSRRAFSGIAWIV